MPILVKANIDVAGTLSTAAMPGLAAWRPEKTAPVVAKLMEAGAIPIAKTTMPEAAFGMWGWSSLHGLTKNAHNEGYTSGGSSTGTAVGLAAGFACAGLGSDTEGSLRGPADFAGIVGMRVTMGRYSSEGVVPCNIKHDTGACALVEPAARPMGFDRLPPCPMLSPLPSAPVKCFRCPLADPEVPPPDRPTRPAFPHAAGPMATTASDVAMIDAIITGTAPTDYAAADLKGMTIAFPPDLTGKDLAPGQSKALALAKEALTKAGATVKEDTAAFAPLAAAPEGSIVNEVSFRQEGFDEYLKSHPSCKLTTEEVMEKSFYVRLTPPHALLPRL